MEHPAARTTIQPQPPSGGMKSDAVLGFTSVFRLVLLSSSDLTTAVDMMTEAPGIPAYVFLCLQPPWTSLIGASTREEEESNLSELGRQVIIPHASIDCGKEQLRDFISCGTLQSTALSKLTSSRHST